MPQRASMKCWKCHRPFKFNGPPNKRRQLLCASARCKRSRKTHLQALMRLARSNLAKRKGGGSGAVPVKTRGSQAAIIRKKKPFQAAQGLLTLRS